MHWWTNRMLALAVALTLSLAASEFHSSAKAQGYDPFDDPLASEPATYGSDSSESEQTEEAPPPAAAKDEEPADILTIEIPEMKGPKRVVAVGKADAIGSFKQRYGDWDIGGGVGAMLTKALRDTGQFIVVERANIQQLLAEQELKGQKLLHQGSGPQIGNIIGVNLLIYLSVTEFSTDDEGGGMSLGLSGGSVGGLFSGALSRQSSSGRIKMIVRLVDTTTGEVVEAHEVGESLENSSWDASVGYQGISFGGNQFMKTPLGQATRSAVNKAVALIAAKAAEIPWSGRIVDVDGQELYINAGRSSGVKVGDMFKIERITKVFTDPTTGKVLGKRKKVLGTVEVTGVEEKLSYGVFLPLANVAPERGDLVVQTTEGS